MRIIAGSAKGRTLASPDGATRPTSDRAREGIFSTVESLIDFEPELHVLDLFAGTGAWGLEAASRGAGHVDLVERESKAVAVCQENISRVGLPVKVHLASVEKWLMQAAHLKYGLVFLDPPYVLANEKVESILSQLLTSEWLEPGALVCVERPSAGKNFTWPAQFTPLRERKYGLAAVHYATWASL
jgi:16S rRNA (guanine966-N2)-methyltransferase